MIGDVLTIAKENFIICLSKFILKLYVRLLPISKIFYFYPRSRGSRGSKRSRDRSRSGSPDSKRSRRSNSSSGMSSDSD